MSFEYNVSIIIPAYNAEKTIENCLNKINKESKRLKSEIIVVDDCSTDRTVEIVKTFQNIKLIKLENNEGAGNARNKGADEAKYENLCFIDSDIIISEESILNLVKRLKKGDNTGSVAATQDLFNLNKESWSSNFVCLKSCYGIDEIKDEKVFSVCCSEFCVISKNLFFKIGKWKAFNHAGGEEFDIGYKITQLNFKNIKSKSANYSGHWCDLHLRFKRIIQRTSKYIPLFLEKKKFDSKGSFATLGQFFSSLITLLIIIYFFISSVLDYSFFNFNLIFLILLQLTFELNFLLFANKNYGFKMVMFSLFGIQVINLGILLGVVMFFYTFIINKLSSEQ
jgi:glycosyltransferase involved in cell wall biosynthesis